MDKDELLHKAWMMTGGLKHRCDKEFGVEIVDFDGRTLWVQMTCICGAKRKLEFQLTNSNDGEWKECETGPIHVDFDTGKIYRQDKRGEWKCQLDSL